PPVRVASARPLAGDRLDGLRHFDVVDDADDCGIDGTVLQPGGHPGGAAADDEHGLADARVNGVDGHQVAAFGLAARIHRPVHQQLGTPQAFVFARRHPGADDFREYHFALAVAFPIGSASSRFACGRGITWTDTSSPTRRAAAAPASVAAFTAATSPRTIAVTQPAPIFSQPTSVTLAAFTIASAASIIATRPLVSTIPSASPICAPYCSGGLRPPPPPPRGPNPPLRPRLR